MAGRLGAVALAIVALVAGPAPAAPPRPGGEAARLVATTRAAVVRFDDPAAAGAAGYQVASVSGPVQHWLNPAYLGDGAPLDPRRPAGLVYLQTGTGLRLMAAMFVLARPGEPDPATPGARWHHHTWCQGAGGVGVPLPGQPCPGGTSPQATPDMLHVWLPWVGVPAFATSMTPNAACRLAGSPGL
jgi:hypothetical protein